MWDAITNFLTIVLRKISKNDTKETWNLLEMRHKANLENLEDLKKLRIKYF